MKFTFYVTFSWMKRLLEVGWVPRKINGASSDSLVKLNIVVSIPRSQPLAEKGDWLMRGLLNRRIKFCLWPKHPSWQVPLLSLLRFPSSSTLSRERAVVFKPDMKVQRARISEEFGTTLKRAIKLLGQLILFPPPVYFRSLFIYSFHYFFNVLIIEFFNGHYFFN